MNDIKDNGDKTLTVSTTKPLGLKRSLEQGVVRQSFSHGRSKAVVVEKVKRRTLGSGETQVTKEVAPSIILAPSVPLPSAEAPTDKTALKNTNVTERPVRRTIGTTLRNLTDEERGARARALQGARDREVVERLQQETEAVLRQQAEEVQRSAKASQPPVFEAGKEDSLGEPVDKREEAKGSRSFSSTPSSPRSAGLQNPNKGSSAATVPPRGRRNLTTSPGSNTQVPTLPNRSVAALSMAEELQEAKRTPRRTGVGPGLGAGGGAKTSLATKPTRGQEPKMRGRLTLSTATGETEERTRSVAAFKRRVQRLKGAGITESREKISREIILPETITIQEIANRMSERAVDVIRLLMRQGQMVKITDVIDADTAQLVAEEMGHQVKRVAESDVEEGLFDQIDEDVHLISRPPVVTIMGHVDHGKTSLLDAIRSENVVSSEAGGITQHIGAYQIKAPNGAEITFIDTPGHAAFTSMRARGAKVTDIVVLVVAADDGVMPQTAEAIHHAQAAKVPIIVAINKIDKPDARPERVRTELLQHQIQVESLGGDTLEVEVSAKEGTNLDKLLELIALQAEMLALKANPDRQAEGTVIEARLDRGRGPVATVLVQRGTLRVGELIVAGTEWGKVRALLNDKGLNVSSALPSCPVEILGFSGAPEAGDRTSVVSSEARAREITAYRQRQKRDKLAARGGTIRGSLADMMGQLKTAGRSEVPIVIKGDVQGSVEAIVAALEKMNTEEVAVRTIHAGVGAVTESDVALAEASSAALIGFNVRAHKEAREAAERVGLEITYYNIIYNLVDDIKNAMSGLLAPTLRETSLGQAEVLEVFNISKVGKVAGCRVLEGTIQRGGNGRLIRDNVVIHEGKLSTLKRFKDEVKEVLAGQECGIAFENYQDLRVSDMMECYKVEEIRRTL